MDLKPKRKVNRKLVITYVCNSFYCDISMQVTHVCDFKYWEIFRGLTVEQIKEREESFEYPPRLQIKCEQINPLKSLDSNFKIFKTTKNNEVPIATFPLVKKVTGMLCLKCSYKFTYRHLYECICTCINMVTFRCA